MLLVLDIAYSYTALMLLFGAAHLFSLLCGAGTLSEAGFRAACFAMGEVIKQPQTCHTLGLQTTPFACYWDIAVSSM